MKSILLLGCGLILLGSPLSAQAALPDPSASDTASVPAPKHQHHHHPDFLSKLSLTSAQQSQVEKIKQTAGLTHKQKHEAIKAVLTPEQVAQLKQLKKSWKAQQQPKQTT